jgi:hypothetical protein
MRQCHGTLLVGLFLLVGIATRTDASSFTVDAMVRVEVNGADLAPCFNDAGTGGSGAQQTGNANSTFGVAVLEGISAQARCALESGAASGGAFSHAAGFAGGTALGVVAGASVFGDSEFSTPLTFGQAGAEITASVGDVFNVTGTGLFKLVFRLHGTAFVEDCGIGQARFGAAGSLGGQAFVLGADACSQGLANGMVELNELQSFLLPLQSGAVLQMDGTLSALVTALAFAPGNEDSQSGVSAANTFNVFLTPVSPGASYVTESGFDYSDPSEPTPPSPTPVPEPGTLTLLGAGVAVAAARARRARAT